MHSERQEMENKFDKEYILFIQKIFRNIYKR